MWRRRCRHWSAARRVPMQVRRTGGRHDLRRFGRHQRHDRQPGLGARLRPAGRRGRRLHLRGDGRVDRLRAHHGGSGPRRRNWPRSSSRRREGGAAYYARMGHGSFAPGNADGGLTTIEEKSLGAYAKSGASRISGLAEARRRAAARRAVSAGRGAGRRAALRLSQHQRQRRDRRADGLRLPPDLFLDRARIGRRLGDCAGHQGLRQPRDLRRMADDMDVDAGRILDGTPWRKSATRSTRSTLRRGGRRQDPVGGTGPSGVHPHLQDLRADWPCLFACCVSFRRPA